MAIGRTWASKFANKFWANISSASPTAEAMPKKNDSGQFNIYGCGHYGCVFATGYSNVVFKITTDDNEARLSKYLSSLKNQPEGIVRYLGVYELPIVYMKRKVYVLWREEAFSVGNTPSYDLLSDSSSRTYDGRVARMFYGRMNSFQAAAGEVRRILRSVKDSAKTLSYSHRYDRWARENYAADEYATNDLYALDKENNSRVQLALALYKGPQRLALALQICRFQSEMIANEPLGTYVGQAMFDLLEEGVLLADVHMGNIGEARRDGDVYMVITDPGHAVDLGGKLNVMPQVI